MSKVEINAVALATDLSVSALLFQSKALLDQLSEYTDDNFPPEAVRIASLLRLLVARAHETLLGYLEVAGVQSRSQSTALRAIGRAIHVVSAYVRYLHASDHFRSPPGIQQAISALVERHAPDAGCAAGEAVVLVRPQWTYNLKYVDVITQLQKELGEHISFALDESMGGKSLTEFLQALWKEESARTPKLDPLPKHVSVLSFAGLDRDDVLLYPLLAHELGHFLDLASATKGAASTASARGVLPTQPAFEKLVATYGSAPSPKWIIDEYESVCEKIQVGMREITADLLATRCAGLAYLFAFYEFFKTLTSYPGAAISYGTGYPGFGFRLNLIWSELVSRKPGLDVIPSLVRLLNEKEVSGASVVRSYLKNVGQRATASVAPLPEPKTLTEAIVRLMADCVQQAVPTLQTVARTLIPEMKAARVPDRLADMVAQLSDRVPPFQPSMRSERKLSQFAGWEFSEVLTAGWVYQIGIGEQAERSKIQVPSQFKEYRDTCLLLFKALELNGSKKAIFELTESTVAERDMEPSTQWQLGKGALCGPSMKFALDAVASKERLVICPDYGDDPIQAASWDLHLGHWFRTAKRTSMTSIDIAVRAERVKAMRRGQSEHFIPFDKRFVLHPGDFALAASLEYVCLPSGVMAFVEGKSSLGRAGLLIATATQVAPGFKGCIVLELYNSGTVPIELRPAMRVAQLVMVCTDHLVPAKWLYAGNFQVQVRP